MSTNYRIVDTTLASHFEKYREILILLGARQVGKTTILQKLFPNAQYMTLDNETTRKNLESYDVSFYKQIFSPQDIIVLDEIHLLSDPGRAAKILYDQMPEHKLIITGSSSLNIKNKSSESLAGRKIDYHLYPLTFEEYLIQKDIAHPSGRGVFEVITGNTNPRKSVHAFDLANTLHTVLVYGLYPRVIDHPDRQTYLTNLLDSVIFKDLLDLRLIDDRKAALETLRLLAHQVGQLVSYAEIAQRVGKNVRTVKKYVQIFHQSFITFELLPYSQNHRDEIGKSPKIYFWDTGIRNALIDNYADISLRSDAGQLFENFIISDFMKSNVYLSAGYKANYWRTKSGSEVDLVLSRHEELQGVEIKYRQEGPIRAFANRYPHARMKAVTSENFF